MKKLEICIILLCVRAYKTLYEYRKLMPSTTFQTMFYIRHFTSVKLNPFPNDKF